MRERRGGDADADREQAYNPCRGANGARDRRRCLTCGPDGAHALERARTRVPVPASGRGPEGGLAEDANVAPAYRAAKRDADSLAAAAVL